MLHGLLKPSDGYHLDCASHDADDSRADRSSWYCEETFAALALLKEVFYADIVQAREDGMNICIARDEEQERTLVCMCNINVNL